MSGFLENNFALKSSKPPDKNRVNLYSNQEDDGPITIRRGRRAIHQEISPISGPKAPRMKEKIINHVKRNIAEKEFLNLKSDKAISEHVPRVGVCDIIKHGIIHPDSDSRKSNLIWMPWLWCLSMEKNDGKLNHDESYEQLKTINQLVEEKGFVMLLMNSNTLQGFSSTKNQLLDGTTKFWVFGSTLFCFMF